MNRVCIIIPHFGHFPNYFPLFLMTCSWNKKFNWLIFTDDETPYDYPSNVKCVKITFSELKEKIARKFEYDISLERPYKLCDYRPLYGYIFSDYLTEYTHWGHCDTDTIMGNLGNFVTDDLLNGYDKIFQLGHLSIYKNTLEINCMAMQKYKGRNVCKDILQNPNNCWFDEEWDPQHNISINKILLEYGKKVYTKDLSLNISFCYNRFVRVVCTGNITDKTPYGFEWETKKKALYVWEKGNLCRHYVSGDKLITEEFPYLHLQKRPMKMQKDILGMERFEIIPDEFRVCKYTNVTIDNFSSIPTPCRSCLTQKMFFVKLINYINKHIR